MNLSDLYNQPILMTLDRSFSRSETYSCRLCAIKYTDKSGVHFFHVTKDKRRSKDRSQAVVSRHTMRTILTNYPDPCYPEVIVVDINSLGNFRRQVALENIQIALETMLEEGDRLELSRFI